MVYDTDARAFRYHNGTSWVLMAPRQQSLADAPGAFSTVPVGGTASLYSYYIPSGRTKIAADGSLYFIAAMSTGTVSFGSTSLSNAAGYSALIAKMDSTGSPLWMKMLPSSATATVSIFDLDVDVSGNLYVGGSFTGTVDFNPGLAVNNLASAGGYDAFVAKYDAAGNYVWAQRYGGTGYESLKSICTDGTIVYMAGDHTGTFTYGASSATVNGTGQNVFLARAQASDGLPGASGWIRTAYTSTNAAASIRVKLYGGSVLWCGHFYGTLSFPTSGFSKTTAGGQDCFFALYNSFGGTSSSNTVAFGGTNTDYVYDMATSPLGNIYLCGYFSGTIAFGGYTLTTTSTNSNGYVVSYNSSLAPQNVYRYGGSVGFDACYGIATDNAGNVYVGGTNNSTDVNIHGRSTSSGISYSSAFLLKLTPDLYYPYWFQLADGVSSYYSDFINGLDVSPDGKKLFSTISAGETNGIIGFDGQRVPTPNYFYISFYKE